MPGWDYMAKPARVAAMRQAAAAGETLADFAARLGAKALVAEAIAAREGIQFGAAAPSSPAAATTPAPQVKRAAPIAPAADRPRQVPRPAAVSQSPKTPPPERHLKLARGLSCRCGNANAVPLIENAVTVGRHRILSLICPCAREERWTHREDAR